MAVSTQVRRPSRADELSTTSFAILGLLALRPWNAYELAQQMRRSLSQFWPRAERKIYEEPKRLVRHGLASAQSELVGRRPRTVYTITPKGRRWLRRWLKAGSSPPVFESEAMLRVFFSDLGDKQDLLAAIASVRAAAESSMLVGAERCGIYLDSGGPFGERHHVIALMAGFLTELADAYHRWANWAEEEAQGWSDTVEPAWDPTPVFRAVVRRGQRIAGTPNLGREGPRRP